MSVNHVWNEILCTDIDECALNGTYPCHPGPAMCTNPVGSFTCSSKSRYVRNRTLCTAIDECADGTHNCHPGTAVCTNAMGSFTCSFKSGYARNGTL